jgi:hypothetical protein
MFDSLPPESTPILTVVFFVITLLVITVLAILAFAFFHKEKKSDDEIESLATGLTESEKSHLNAFKFYSEYHMPEPAKENLLKKHLVKESGQGVGITDLGVSVGKKAGLFSKSEMLITVN